MRSSVTRALLMMVRDGIGAAKHLLPRVFAGAGGVGANGRQQPFLRRCAGQPILGAVQPALETEVLAYIGPGLDVAAVHPHGGRPEETQSLCLLVPLYPVQHARGPWPVATKPHQRRPSRWRSSGSRRRPDWPAEDVEVALAAKTSAERDDQGRRVGLALTLRPTPHRFTVDSRRLFAWCASDTLMLPVVIGRPAVVESTCRRPANPSASRSGQTACSASIPRRPSFLRSGPRTSRSTCAPTPAPTGTSSTRPGPRLRGARPIRMATSSRSRTRSGSTERSWSASAGKRLGARPAKARETT